MSTKVQVEYEIIPIHKLPEGCHLAKMWERLEVIAEDSKPLHGKFNTLSAELREVEAFLDSASLERGTTPEEYSIATARKVLLERAVERAGRPAKSATAGYEASLGNFNIEYERYKGLVRKLRAFDRDTLESSDWRYTYLTEEDRAASVRERNRLVQGIESLIGQIGQRE